MNQLKIMASAQASKAFVAALLAAITAATIAATDGFTLVEILTIAGAIVVTFQATYWTPNETKYDGTIDVEQQGPTKLFSLNLDSDPADLDTKNKAIFKIIAK